MKTYLVSPQAPLMFRDGRNFSADAAIADTLSFPRPSTLAGAMRTAWAESQRNFDYANEDNRKLLLSKSVQGPLLAEINGQQQRVLFPAPADSICLTNDAGEKQIYRLKPAEIDADNEGVDFLNKRLMPVFLQGANNQKPVKQPPAFWYAKAFDNWLVNDNPEAPVTAQLQGIPALPVDERTHVAINPETLTNKTSHLYQTAGIDFSRRQLHDGLKTSMQQHGWQAQRYCLLMRFADTIPDGFRTIGGEARLGKISNVANCWPKPSEKLITALNKAKCFRLYLITPAIFTNGYLPDFLNKETLYGELGELEVTLCAAAIPRWQAGTSWDMLFGKNGKGMRKLDRLVPAGAVYWFEIKKGDANQLKNYWLTSISDERSNDGYGLVVPGVWSK